MSERADVVIVGGGPAGSTAAAVLAHRGYVVELIEKRRMPREKLCGEFLSSEAASICRRLGVLGRLRELGAREIRRLRISSTRGDLFEIDLPDAALGISRHTLDQILFEHASNAGVRTREGCTVHSIDGDLENGFRVLSDEGPRATRIVIGAFGRRNRLDDHVRGLGSGDRSPYVAFKAHFSGSDLSDVIELHAFSGGYCGVLSEDHGHVNVCWIGHRRVLQEAGGDPDAMLDRMTADNRHLAKRLSPLNRVGPYTASGQLVFRAGSLFSRDVCLIGDAAGMIAPLCGDGMAMAICGADIAASFADDLLQGRISAAGYRDAYVRSWRRRFRTRMFLGRVIHAAYVRPSISKLGVRAAGRMPAIARTLVRATRG